METLKAFLKIDNPFYRDNKFEELREFLPNENVFSYEEDSY